MRIHEPVSRMNIITKIIAMWSSGAFEREILIEENLVDLVVNEIHLIIGAFV
jgi:hypothetical protein